MIDINGKEYYTVKDLESILCVKSAMITVLLRKYNAPKYKNKYIADLELVNRIKNRNNRTPKLYDLDEDSSYIEMVNLLSRPKKIDN